MKTTLMVTVGIAIVAIAAVTAIARHHPVKDAYFDPDSDKLWQVPANLLVIRPTHFPQTHGMISHYHEGDSLARTVGRNVSFQMMMAEACDCDFAQVVLPPGAPQGNFDFLVTRPAHVRQQLRTAIQKQLGYAAHPETRDMDALILKVNAPSLPGLTVSAEGENAGISYNNGKLHFTHRQLGTIVKGLSQGLDKPILDQTGLTNYYDFSVVWNRGIDKRMQHGSFSMDGTKKVLAGWGLSLEPTNISMQVCVVDKAH